MFPHVRIQFRPVSYLYRKANEPAPGTSQQAAAAAALQALANARLKSPRSGGGLHRSDSGSQQQLRLNGWSSRQRLAKEGGGKPGMSGRKELPMKPGKLTRSAMSTYLLFEMELLTERVVRWNWINVLINCCRSNIVLAPRR